MSPQAGTSPPLGTSRLRRARCRCRLPDAKCPFPVCPAACGLYYLAELCEEYVITAKRVIGHTIKAELLLHLLLFWDRLPAACLGCGIAAHLSYLRLLKPFPYIQLSSGSGLASIALWLASSGLWVRHFMTTYYTGEEGWVGRQVVGGCMRFGGGVETGSVDGGPWAAGDSKEVDILADRCRSVRAAGLGCMGQAEAGTWGAGPGESGREAGLVAKVQHRLRRPVWGGALRVAAHISLASLPARSSSHCHTPAPCA